MVYSNLKTKKAKKMNKKFYEPKKFPREVLTQEDIDRLIAGAYTHYIFPDGSEHSIIPVKHPKAVVGQKLEPITHSRGVVWGWVAVMKKDWKPARPPSKTRKKEV